MKLIEKMLNDWAHKRMGLVELYRIKKWLEYLTKIENWENREDIKSEMIQEDCGYVLPFLIIYIEKWKTDIFLNCAKMESDRLKKSSPFDKYLEALWLTEDATIVNIANKLREKLLESNRKYRYNIEKDLS